MSLWVGAAYCCYELLSLVILWKRKYNINWRRFDRHASARTVSVDDNFFFSNNCVVLILIIFMRLFKHPCFYKLFAFSLSFFFFNGIALINSRKKTCNTKNEGTLRFHCWIIIIKNIHMILKSCTGIYLYEE